MVSPDSQAGFPEKKRKYNGAKPKRISVHRGMKSCKLLILQGEIILVGNKRHQLFPLCPPATKLGKKLS